MNNSVKNLDDLLFQDDNDSSDEIPSTAPIPLNLNQGFHTINASHSIPNRLVSTSSNIFPGTTNRHMVPTANHTSPASGSIIANTPSTNPLLSQTSLQPSHKNIHSGIPPTNYSANMTSRISTSNTTPSQIGIIHSNSNYNNNSTNFNNKAKNPTQVVKHMLIMLRQMIQPEQFQRLSTEFKTCNNDYKKLMEIIRGIAGDEIFSKIMKTIAGEHVINPSTNVNNHIPSNNANANTNVPQINSNNNNSSTLSRNVNNNNMNVDPTIGNIKPGPNIPNQSLNNKPTSNTLNNNNNNNNNNPSNLSVATAAAQMEQLMNLLTHAVSCNKDANTCPISRCEHIRRLYKHSAKCSQPYQCQFCRRLHAWVTIHTKHCSIPITNHCPIPLCDKLKRQMHNVSSANAHTNNKQSVTNDPNTGTSQVANKKDNNSKPASGPSQFDIYGDILQLLLHSKDCNNEKCDIKNCIDSKIYLRQINSPNPPPRARTYKQVLDHYRNCKIRQTCPLCIRGLRPLRTDQTSTTYETSHHRPTALSTQKSTPKSNDMDAVVTSHNGLIEATFSDIRFESDVLSHSKIDLTEEENELLQSSIFNNKNIIKKNQSFDPNEKISDIHFNTIDRNEFNYNDLFSTKTKMNDYIKKLSIQNGVIMGKYSKECLFLALDNYLKTTINEMFLISQKRKRTETTQPTINDTLNQIYEKDLNMIEKEDIARKEEIENILKNSNHSSIHTNNKTNGTSNTKEKVRKKRKTVSDKNENQIITCSKEELDKMDIEEIGMESLKRSIQQKKLRLKNDINTNVSSLNNNKNKDYSTTNNVITMKDAKFWLLHKCPLPKQKLFYHCDSLMIKKNYL